MKLFLDSVRRCPEGWIGFKSAYKMLAFMSVHYIETHEVTHISLDYNLGIPFSPNEHEENGMCILKWLEEMLNTGQLDNVGYLPIITVHSSNTVLRQNMTKLIVKLEQDLFDRLKKRKTIKDVFKG